MELRRILETCLYADDLASAKQFYGQVLGLAFYAEEAGRHVFFKLPDGGMLLIFRPQATQASGQGLPSHGAQGAQHLAFEVEAADYDAWKAKVADAGTPIEHEQRWQAGNRSFYFRDPAGHLIEICEPGLWR